MSSNAQKTPIARSLNEFALRKAQSAIQLLGKALPASVVKVDPTVGSPIVTVKFEVQSPFTLPNVTVPLAGSEYIRLPLQPGAKGVVFPADTFLGAMSGLGSGTATLVQPGNLSALVFFPIGNLNWTAPDEINALELYGEPDVIIKEKGGTAVFKAKPNLLDLKVGNFQISVTNASITLTDGGANTIVIDGAGVHINGRTFLTHQHSGVQAGGANSGGVV